VSTNSDQKSTTCANPLCKKPFAGRAGKTYCCTKCKSAHHNAKTKVKNAPMIARNKELLRHDKALKEIFETGLYHKTGVPKLILDHYKFIHDLSTEQNGNAASGGKIRWFYSYGIEARSETLFIIYKKTA
jgi:hypothetical protein